MRKLISMLLVAAVMFSIPAYGFDNVEHGVSVFDLSGFDRDPQAYRPDGEKPDRWVYSEEWQEYYWVMDFSFGKKPVFSPDGSSVYSIGLGPYITKFPLNGEAPSLVYRNYLYVDEYYAPMCIDNMYDIGTDENTLLIQLPYNLEDQTGVHAEIEEDGTYSWGVFNGVSTLYSLSLSDNSLTEVKKDVQTYVESESGRYCYTGYFQQESNKAIGIVEDVTTGIKQELSGEYGGICFTPDDTYIVAVRYGDDKYDRALVKISLDTYEVTSVAGSGGDCYTVPFLTYGITHDGSWAVYCSNDAQENYFIEARHLDTGETVTLSAMPKGSVPLHGALSPDSGKIAYTVWTKGDIWPTDLRILDIDLPMKSDLQTSVADESPASFALLGNYPNPFNPTTTIGFTLSEPGSVNLTVYSVTGQTVRELVSEGMAPGRHSVVWDGRDDMGDQVAAGVYISHLIAGGQSVSGRMTLVK